MTVKKNSALGTLPDTSVSISFSAKQGIKTAWYLWWTSWKALIKGEPITFSMYSEPKKEIINCSRHTKGYPLCDYDNPWCVWSV